VLQSRRALLPPGVLRCNMTRCNTTQRTMCAELLLVSAACRQMLSALQAVAANPGNIQPHAT
jgi:hypothetical protein